MSLNSIVVRVTNSIIQRSQVYRKAYLERIDAFRNQGIQRNSLSCTNLAHGFAACSTYDKMKLKQQHVPSVAIISAYNDMLSAHQPFECFPRIIKDAIREAGGIAQFAGGVPAMCDGITQGQTGMELSLFSRDTIAMATAIALSHNMFDAALCLGVCDKIVPGLLIGALHFGHIPAVFIPAGPMPTNTTNQVKIHIRQLYVKGKISREKFLEEESKSYHSPGTCTFYGTANSNQMLMEAMGLHLPSSAFIAPNTALRNVLTATAAKQVLKLTNTGTQYTPLGYLVNEKSIVNAIVALLATGGSTNHTLHLVAIAKAAGLIINWDDFAALSSVVPLIACIYPNGSADINDFQIAGGISFVLHELLEAGLLYDDVTTILGSSLRAHCRVPSLVDGTLVWNFPKNNTLNPHVLRKVLDPFSMDGGLRLMQGNLGRAIIKVSALKPEHRVIQAPAIVFYSQTAFMRAFTEKELDKDFIAVIMFQGPRANGMPELHSLTPALGSLQDQGYHVAIVTDGRMSGASGKVPAAIHVTPEALAGGNLGLVRTGDLIYLNANTGILEAKVDKVEWASREIIAPDLSTHHTGCGRELFSVFRNCISTAEEGCTVF